jgi:tight adherence protein B
MGIAILAFLVMTAAVVAGWVTSMRLPEFLAGRRMERRLRDVSAAPEVPGGGEGEATVVKQKDRGPLPAVERLVSGTQLGSGLSKLIEQSGVRVSPGAVAAISIGTAAAAAFLSMILVRHPLAPIVAGLVGLMVPTLFLKQRRAARLKKFEEQFPEALDLLSRAVRAGHAFQTAMSMVASELKEPVGPEFKKTFEQQNYGLPLRDALNEMADRVNILDVRFFVTAVLIQRESGGNLAEILDNLAHVVRERFKILRQVRVHTAHGRFTGWVLMALPAALAVALSFINPDHMTLLFKESLGQLLLLVAIVMQIVGFIWIRQVIKIEV